MVEDIQLLGCVFEEVAVAHGVVAHVVLHGHAVGVVDGEAALVVVVERVVRHQGVRHDVLAVVEVQR